MATSTRATTQKSVVKLSATMRSILSRTESYGPLTVASFLYCAAQGGKAPKGTAVSVLTSIFADVDMPDAFEKLLFNTKDSATDAGMQQALNEANRIRTRTGGNDDYVGLRYVLFVIVTAQNDPLKAEVESLFEALGVSRAKAADAITRYCMSAREAPEKVSAWEKIIAARPVAADAPRGQDFVVVDPDDPWLAGLSDRSGATLEANAFATMICAREFWPPLAVGVFGDWGTGKSFFMRSVYDAIVSRAFVRGMADKDAKATFIDNVVQIRFNAWHYAETNLWASLIDNIFTSLDRWVQKKNPVVSPLDKLSTARRLTIEAAETLVQSRKEESDAENALSAAQAALQEKIADVAAKPATYATTAWAALTANPAKKTALEDAATTLNLQGLADSASHFQAGVGELDRELAGFSLFRSTTIRWLSLPIVVIGVAVAVTVLPPLLKLISDRLNLELSHAALTLSGVVAPIVATFGFAARRTSDAIEKVRGFRKDFEAEVQKLVTDEEQARKTAETDLAAARQAVDEAAARLRMAVERAAEAAQDYNEQDGKGRMLRFVRDRVADGGYAKHLGFVALVRRDFEELSALMTLAKAPDDAKARLAAHRLQVKKLIKDAGGALTAEERKTLESTLLEQKAEEAFERIVLYIDDLDRCPPEQVVAVLQAIHLLLTFPLFVVFVAVDVRWLRHALCKQYDGQISLSDEQQSIATASDYLEKIFQLPYWVRPMGVDGTREILFDRMGTEAAPADEELRLSSAPEPHDGAIRSDPARPAISVASTSVVAPKANRLRLTQRERDYIASMAEALDGSPRRTLRFINLYRVIKASLAPGEFQALERSEYAALATLLAISIAADDVYPRLVPYFREFGNAADVRAELTRLGIGHDIAERIEKALTLLRAQKVDRDAVRRLAPLVLRFSFQPAAGAQEVSAGLEPETPTGRAV